jgi:Kef-type K+ transport system membrane component KefB
LVASLAIGYALITSLYVGLALAASSTLVVVRLLQRRRQLFEPFGRLVLGVLLVQDLLIILLAPVLMWLPQGLLAVVSGLGLTVLLILLAYVLQRWVLPRVVLRWEFDGESLLLMTLVVLFGFIGLTVLFGLPIISGAFLAGVALSSFPVNGLVREQLNPLQDFFLSIFFISLGALVVVPVGVHLLAVVVFVLVVLLVTPPLVALLAERSGFSARASLESGLLLSQTSEFSLIVALLALSAGQIEPEVFSVIALVTVLTMVITPFLATDRNTWRLLRFHPVRQPERVPAPTHEHIVMLGCGDSGMPLLETLYLSGYDVFVIDDDPAVVRSLRENDVPAVRGDAADPDVLAAAHIENARAVISTVRRPADARVLLERYRDVPVLVRVFSDEDAAAVAAMGGTPVRYAEVAADAFMAWLATLDREHAPRATPLSADEARRRRQRGGPHEPPRA